MSDSLNDAILYLSIGLLLYYFLIALLTPNQGAGVWGQYLAWAFLFLIIFYIGYLAWSQYQEKNNKLHPKGHPLNSEQGQGQGQETDFLDNDDDDLDQEDLDRSIPSSVPSDSTKTSEKGPTTILEDEYRIQRRRFNLSDQPVSEDDGIITYDYFKRWYLSPDFLKKYTEAIKQALLIKRKRLIALRKQYREDLAALRPKGKPNDSLSRLFQSVDKTDDTATLESTITEMTDLLKEIKKRQTNVSIETTRQALVSALNHPENGLDTLTGRGQIKDFLALQLYTFAQNPRTFFANFQNMIVKGPSGAGKTKLAKVIGHVYASSGILIRHHVHIITKEALTTPYVNQSAKMTRKLFLSNLESVVFIDEAYDLAPQPNLLGRTVDHGSEALTEMINFIDKMNLSIVIAAGYEKDMDERFMTANEGMDRRFPHKLVLGPYSASELTTILLKFLIETCPEIEFTQDMQNYIFTIINCAYSKKPSIFDKQAGDMCNLSGSVARAIYGSHRKKWPEQSEEIILSGFNAYLAQKGHSLRGA